MVQYNPLHWRIKATAMVRGLKAASYLLILYSSKRQNYKKFIRDFLEESNTFISEKHVNNLINELYKSNIIEIKEEKITIKNLLKFLENALSSGCPLEYLVEALTWKEFEDLCSQIVSNFSFEIKKNYRFKLKNKRYEIDILAIKGNTILSIDCKQWSRHSNLSSAAQKHEKKSFMLKKYLKKKESIIIPVIIVYKDTNVSRIGDTFIVPLFKLKNFLNEISQIIP